VPTRGQVGAARDSNGLGVGVRGLLKVGGRRLTDLALKMMLRYI
jgi:hypothetical protein